MAKSIIPSKPAETGIFKIRNQDYQGFQQGDPRVRQPWLLLDIYSGYGSFEIVILQKDYASSVGVTQPEVNRIIQSLHKSAASDVARAGNRNS